MLEQTTNMENDRSLESKEDTGRNRFLEIAVTIFLAVVFCFLILKFLFF